MTKLPPELRASLRFMDAANEDVNLDDFPTFLIAGPQRTGSTWLYAQLESHPQILLTDPKEVFYFNLLKKVEHQQHWTDDLGQYLKLFQLTPAKLAERNEQCQRLFGRPFEPIARGDATASSAAGIDEDRMAEMVKVSPDLRVIIMVRNPIERGWSHAKLVVERKRGLSVDQENPDEIERCLRWDWHVDCGMYSAMYDRWSKHLKEGNLFFRAFDEIRERPTELLLEILTFVGVDANPKLLKKPAMAGSNPTRSSAKIPARFDAVLREIYGQEIETLRERFGIGTDW